MTSIVCTQQADIKVQSYTIQCTRKLGVVDKRSKQCLSAEGLIQESFYMWMKQHLLNTRIIFLALTRYSHYTPKAEHNTVPLLCLRSLVPKVQHWLQDGNGTMADTQSPLYTLLDAGARYVISLDANK